MRLAFFLSFLIVFVGANSVSASQLKRGYKALEVYDYFKAKKLLSHAKKYNPSTAAYGLSIIYSRNDNPFYNKDSAYLYIQIADSTWNTTSDRKKEKWARFNWSKGTIDSMKLLISSQFFQDARIDHSIGGYSLFIKNHPWAKEVNSAIESRDSLAFFNAVESNTANSYRSFTEKYPNSRYRKLADDNYFNSQYFEITANGELDSYLKFIEDFPNSPMRKEADLRVYEIVTAPNTIEAYELFVLGYPDNSIVDKGWTEFYQIYIEDYSKRRMMDFVDMYPMASNMEEVKKDIDLFDATYLPYSINGKYGYMNDDGRSVVSARYQLTSSFNEGLAICADNDRYGFINKKGQWQIEPRFESVNEIINGRSIVEQNELLGLVDRNGKMILPCEYEDIGELSNGLIYFSKSDLYGYVDVNGNVVIEPVYSNASDFSNKMAVIEIDGKKGLIDRNGKMLLDTSYNELRIVNDSIIVFERDDLKGIISLSGRVKLEPKYSFIGDFVDGLALVSLGDTVSYINLNGEKVISKNHKTYPNYKLKGEFSNDAAIVFKDGKYGRVNKAGDIISDVKYENLGIGKRFIPYKLKGFWGLMSLSNKVLISAEYSSLDLIDDKFVFAKKDDWLGVMDVAGNIIVPFSFNTIEHVLDSCFIVRNQNKFGLYDANTLCTDMSYDRIGYLKDDFVFLVKGTILEYYDLKRKCIIKYEEIE